MTLILIAILVIAGGAYFLISTGRVPNPKTLETENISLGEQIYTQTKNPLEEKLPETNPFAVETNPVKKAYPNPFD